MEHGQPDGLAGPVGAAPGPGAGPGEERFDVAGAVELVETDHLWMVVGQPVAQHPNGLDASLAGRGPQRGRDGRRVADHVSADLGLGDLAGVLNSSPRPGARIDRGLVDDALLKAHLPQAGASLREPLGRRRGNVHPGGLGGCVVEVAVGQRRERLVEPQAQDRSGVTQDLASPVRTPTETGGGCGRCGDVGLVGQGPPDAEIDPTRLREE